MRLDDVILDIDHLSVNIKSPAGTVTAVRDVSLRLHAGEVLAVVGESGCGKSMLCRSIMGLLPASGCIVAGRILFDGRDITAVSERERRSIMGKDISMIFQDPMTSLNPTMCVGDQIAEVIRIHEKGVKKADCIDRVVSLMEMVGIEHAGDRYKMYPYDFSGGMRQRCVMALALACNPRVLLADEPTTALDVTVQAQILELLKRIQKTLNTSIILVSHDMGVVAGMADRVAIMYAGKIVEVGLVGEVFHEPMHPYTRGLLRSLPALSKGAKELSVIPGMPPVLIDLPPGDSFAPRNPQALEIDFVEEPPFYRISDTHFAASRLLEGRYERVVG